MGAAAVAGLAVPALQAREATGLRKAPHSSRRSFGGIGSFTPAAADPKLAALLARTGLPESGFRFTPSESQKTGLRGVTVAVRSRSNRDAGNDHVASLAPTNLGVAPIAYNMGVAVGWRRLAVSSDITHVDLASQPGGHESVDVGVSYTGKRFSGRVKAASDRPVASVPQLVTDLPSYSIDVGGSYSLTRHLDVTAGVRYKSERDRLSLSTPFDERHDSQAVYIGTAFRF